MAKKKPCIVIDPGHGGDDTGAIGYNQIEEKKVVLAVAKLVRTLLSRKGYDSLLTRSTDEFLMLNQRTALSNAVGADVFVSIHANASLNKQAVGIETFFYPHGYGHMQQNEHTSYLKAYLVQKSSYAQALAQNIQQALCAEISLTHDMRAVIDRKVKKAPFQVLIGTCQPSVLVEVGFLTHSYESGLLASQEYKKRIARGIVKGIEHYFNDVF